MRQKEQQVQCSDAETCLVWLMNSRRAVLLPRVRTGGGEKRVRGRSVYRASKDTGKTSIFFFF